jgi:hypothetical protein
MRRVLWLGTRADTQSACGDGLKRVPQDESPAIGERRVALADGIR